VKAPMNYFEPWAFWALVAVVAAVALLVVVRLE
jgi:hypothetical protein